MTRTKTFYCNALYENCHAVSAEGTCVLIDPGFDGPDELSGLYDYLRSGNLTPAAILLTHAHPDHIVSAGVLQRKYGIPVYMSAAEEAVLAANGRLAAIFGTELPPIDPFDYTPVADGDTLQFGPAAGLCFRAIATPGHTPGGICWYDEADGLLFSGDTLFAGTIGRTDLPLGEYDDLIRSVMEKIMILPGETEVYPGHGPSTGISEERTCNPFLQPFNEPEPETENQF